MYPKIIEHIRQYVAIDDATANVALEYIHPLKAARKDYLLKEGQVCKRLLFVEQGCLRMFFINDKGIEQITQFAIEQWWMADYMSYDRQQPSHFSIQAVEPCELYALDHAQQEELLLRLPQLERYFRLMLQKAVAAHQQRIKFLHDLSKEESYEHFTGMFRHFAQRIPQYMMASYLGFTPEYLSELRKKKR